MRTCIIEDCDITRIDAKGMCRKHYRRTIPRTPDKPNLVNCDGCGLEILRHKSKRYPKSYCSDVCRHWDMWGAWTSAWPKKEPAAKIVKAKPAHPALGGRLVAGLCNDCAQPFVALSTTGVAKFCSEACQRRTMRRARRAREYDAPGEYRYSDTCPTQHRGGGGLKRKCT